MSAHALLKRFDIVADHSANIPALRRLVVDLAVRGKLLRSDELDMDVQEMLGRISAKVSELTLAGLIKKQKPLSIIGNDEVPAAYLAHCTFARLGNIANLQKGLTGIQSSMPGEYPLVVTAAERGTCDHFDFDSAAAIIPLVSSTGHGNASINRLHYQEGKFALGTILCAVIPFDEQLISARFLYEYLTAFKEELLVSKMIGTANVTLTLGKIADVPVPILAPAVQKRVDELMALCDQLEAAQLEREHRRDRLAATSLQRLNQPATDTPPEAQHEHARFHLHQLPRLTTRPEHIKALRQTVLNLAVRGKLVPQDSSDEPVQTCLLKNDAVRKEVASSDRRADVDTQELLESELCWDVPTTWAWRGLADLALFIDYRGQTPNKVEAGVRLITAKNVKPGFVNLYPEEFLTESAYDDWMTRGFPKVGDVLFTTEAPMGNAAVVKLPERFALAQRVINFRLYGAVNPHFLVLQLISQSFQKVLDKTATGLTAKGIKAAKLKRLPIIVPPLAEQHRIVGKVDELMALCDQIETQIANTQTDSRRLLESVLDAMLGITRAPEVVTSPPPILDSDLQIGKASRFMTKNPAMTVDQLLECIDDLGGSASPDRLLKQTGLWANVEVFYDLLRAARDSGKVTVPLGVGESVQRHSNAD